MFKKKKKKNYMGAAEGCGPQVRALGLRGAENHAVCLPEALLLSHFHCVRLLATPWSAAYQAPPSMYLLQILNYRQILYH